MNLSNDLPAQDDQKLNLIMSDIENLLKRYEDHSNDSPIHEPLRQTGRFGDTQPAAYELPKKFQQGQRSHTPKKKVQVKSPSSSSSSSSDQRKYNQKKSKKSCLSQRSCLSKAKSQVSQKSMSSFKPPKMHTLQSQKSISPIRNAVPPQAEDVFCVVCEEFIPIDFVAAHLNECVEDQGITSKLKKLQTLLSMRYEQKEDEAAKIVIQVLHACTQSIQDAQDSYTLQKCLEDLCILKVQLAADNDMYNILTVAAKINDLALQKNQLLLQPNLLQSSIKSKQSQIQPQSHGQQCQPNTQLSFQFSNYQLQGNQPSQISPPEQMNQTQASAVAQQNLQKPLIQHESQNGPNQMLLQRGFSQGARPANNQLPTQQAEDKQSLVSYYTNNTTVIRKRLFDQPKLNILPKQLVTVSQKPEASKQDSSSKIGIEYGNNFDSSKSRKFIRLSSQKMDTPQKTSSPVQTQQSPQKQQSVLSGISGFFSRLSVQGEQQKKKFFDIAVSKKNRLRQDHPAQNILISDMYEQLKKQQIQEKDWSEWIDNIFKNA